MKRQAYTVHNRTLNVAGINNVCAEHGASKALDITTESGVVQCLVLTQALRLVARRWVAILGSRRGQDVDAYAPFGLLWRTATHSICGDAPMHFRLKGILRCAPPWQYTCVINKTHPVLI